MAIASGAPRVPRPRECLMIQLERAEVLGHLKR
jgi:hypothetical protein